MRKWNNHWALMITFFSFLFLLLAVFDACVEWSSRLFHFQCKTDYGFFFRSQYSLLPQETFHYFHFEVFFTAIDSQWSINRTFFLFIKVAWKKFYGRGRKKAIARYNVAVGLDFSFDEHHFFHIINFSVTLIRYL